MIYDDFGCCIYIELLLLLFLIGGGGGVVLVWGIVIGDILLMFQIVIGVDFGSIVDCLILIVDGIVGNVVMIVVYDYDEFLLGVYIVFGDGDWVYWLGGGGGWVDGLILLFLLLLLVLVLIEVWIKVDIVVWFDDYGVIVIFEVQVVLMKVEFFEFVVDFFDDDVDDLVVIVVVYFEEFMML